MGWIRRTLVVCCLLLVVAAPFAATASAVSGDASPDANSSSSEGPETRELSVTDTVENVTNATTDVVENVTNTSTGVVENVTNAPTGIIGNVTDAPTDVVGNVTNASTSVVGNVTDAPTSVVGNVTNASTGVVGNVTNASTGVVGNVTNVSTGVVENVTNASTGVVENGTNRSVRHIGNGTNETEGTTAVGAVLDGAANGVVSGLSPGAVDLAELLEGELRSPVELELPRLAITDSALVVEGNVVSLDGLSTVIVPFAVDDAENAATGDVAADALPDPGTASDPADEDDRTNRSVSQVSTPAPNATNATNGTVGAAEASNPDGVFDFHPAAPLEFAPPLGTAMFAVAARPWFGLLSGAAAVAANWLSEAFVLFRYRRRDGSDPLEHETRERIHDLVSETPGRTLTELSEELDTPLSTVRHHVKVLERERVVVTRKLRGNRRFYPLDVENEELAAALQEESSAAVITVLHEQGRATVGEVVDRVEKSYSTVSYHLSRLAEDDLVVQERDGRETISRLEPSIESLLDASDDRTRSGLEHTGQEASAD